MLIVRRVRSVAACGILAGGGIGSVGGPVCCVSVLLSMGGGTLWGAESIPNIVGVAGEQGGGPVEGVSSSSGCGELGGEEGNGKCVSLGRSGRMTKVGSGFHPMLCRLLGKREGRCFLGDRTGSEPGTKFGQ